MIAIDPPVRLLIFALASEGPSTHDTAGRGNVGLRKPPGSTCLACGAGSGSRDLLGG